LGTERPSHTANGMKSPDREIPAGFRVRQPSREKRCCPPKRHRPSDTQTPAPMLPRKARSACQRSKNRASGKTFSTHRRNRRPEDPGSPRSTKPADAYGQTAIAIWPRRRTELAYRELSHVRVRAANCQGLPEQMEPILSWVFTSLGYSPLLPWPHQTCSLLSRT
jgi:hypothetical protein